MMPTASVLAAAGLVAAVSSLLTAALLGSGSAGEADEGVETTAILEPDPTAAWPAQLGSDGRSAAQGVRYDDYLGLAVASAPSARGERERCLFVLPLLTSAALVGGCSAGPFAAEAVLVVSADLPDELLDVHPAGSALRFRLEGSRVVVDSGERFGAGAPPPLVF